MYICSCICMLNRSTMMSTTPRFFLFCVLCALLPHSLAAGVIVLSDESEETVGSNTAVVGTRGAPVEETDVADEPESSSAHLSPSLEVESEPRPRGRLSTSSGRRSGPRRSGRASSASRRPPPSAAEGGGRRLALEALTPCQAHERAVARAAHLLQMLDEEVAWRRIRAEEVTAGLAARASRREFDLEDLSQLKQQLGKQDADLLLAFVEAVTSPGEAGRALETAVVDFLVLRRKAFAWYGEPARRFFDQELSALAAAVGGQILAPLLSGSCSCSRSLNALLRSCACKRRSDRKLRRLTRNVSRSSLFGTAATVVGRIAAIQEKLYSDCGGRADGLPAFLVPYMELAPTSALENEDCAVVPEWKIGKLWKWMKKELWERRERRESAPRNQESESQPQMACARNRRRRRTGIHH